MARSRGYVVPKRLSIWEQEELRLREEEKKKREAEKLERERQEAWDRRWNKTRVNDLNAFSFSNFVEKPISLGKHWGRNLTLDGRVLTQYKLFEKKQLRSEFPCAPVIQAWHGTNIRNLSKIAKYSLKTGHKHCLYGSGIYTTRDLQKALRYGRNGDVLVLLRCSVAVGNIYYSDSSGDKSSVVGLDKEYQSVYTGARSKVHGAWGGMVQGEEFVVYDSSQVEVTEIYVWKQLRSAPVVKEPSKQRIGAKHRYWEHRRRKDAARPKPLVPTHPCQRVVDGALAFCKNIYWRWNKDNTVKHPKCILTLDLTNGEWCRSWEKSRKK